MVEKQSAQEIAEGEHISAGESAWATARNSSRLDAEMAAQLRMVLSESFRTAKTWLELIRALRIKGFYLERKDGRMRLRDAHSHVEICTCRFLGFPGGELETRFGEPLPEYL
ncbi:MULTISPECIES: hypothetical protein [Phaeobacter]|uniref:Uncharacterized protein n=2 Tax=Phaeobacter piscinae TaxID=1580596 RepID=A0ABN5DAR6_9RHOB|nr:MULTISPECIES: hypothetical protein [Phaeobacter]ATG34276.1 hypothetical protein PhaeoP36_00101 [Phaeobacter piscinae]AUQ84796.1 hypothetical protein PhaeoP42_00101 [Phaeobacter piscinae]AUR22680.1 hypothetical protein PhaeoP23_00101 [Phaeobacter piscinae]KII18559.1 hypothetical protein OO25_01125 [Phaeobacter sp. S60]UTS79058.1 hypothetical protein OL67_000101 [Phaeobacter piscinae]